MIKTKKRINLTHLLGQFTAMCQNSRAPDGDWQGDGWGIAWREKNVWNLKKSLLPIWEENHNFPMIQNANLLVAHARSAGFPEHKGNIDYNQPFINDSLCFVFNGMIRGVNLSRHMDGTIGAQKLFSLLAQHLRFDSVKNSLKSVDKIMLKNAKRIEGMNIGLAQNDKMYALCEYEDNAAYFGLQYYQDENLSLICSSPVDSYKWKTMKKGEILVL